MGKTQLDYLSVVLVTFQSPLESSLHNKGLAGKFSPATQAGIQIGCMVKEGQTRKNRSVTSGSCPFHVEPCLIRHKIFRSRFLGSIVQLADFMANDEIIALARDFFLAHQIASSGPSNLTDLNVWPLRNIPPMDFSDVGHTTSV